MRRTLVFRHMAGSRLAGLQDFLQALRQPGAQRLQLIQLLLLSIDRLIQAIQQIFLMCDPNFNIDETFFHEGFLCDETEIEAHFRTPRQSHTSAVDDRPDVADSAGLARWT